MKVVLLDFDGVIVRFSAPAKKARPAVADPRAVDCLNQIIARTGAQIVVTSDWRKSSSSEKLQDCLNKWRVIGEVIDKTSVRPDGDRGLEVAQWLVDNAPIKSYVILDDEWLDHVEVGRWQVRCEPMLGLCVVDRVVEILNSPTPWTPPQQLKSRRWFGGPKLEAYRQMKESGECEGSFWNFREIGEWSRVAAEHIQFGQRFGQRYTIR
jgi:hypothetical protein